MRQRATATVAALALAVVLLVNFKAPEDATVGLVTGTGTTGSSGTSSGAATGPDPDTGTMGRALGSSTGSSGSGSGTGSGSSSVAGGTFTGPVAASPYGNVEVQITVVAGKVTDVQALALPSGGHSGRISSFVRPILRTQALTAQSAAIDGVSGATYTSRAYAESLQGALDAARL
jgi:uncharacterized protein with FMN-binding domain